LFSFAHPDDESFYGVGLAMQCQAQGIPTALVTATLGQRGKTGNPPVCRPEDLASCRKAELQRVAGIVGIRDLHILDYRDRELTDAKPDEIRRSLVALIRRHRPTVVLTFDPNGFNMHPDHVAISRYTMDAVAAAGDRRWEPETGDPHATARVLWTSPIAPWEAGRRTDLSSEPGVDFVVEVSAWADRKAAALKAHRSQHISIDRCFFSQPDVDRILSVEVFRQAEGPDLTRRPADDVFEGIAGASAGSLIETPGSGRRPSPGTVRRLPPG
jgi:LmbE family N-acetylglucosaminyl deacetylase